MKRNFTKLLWGWKQMSMSPRGHRKSLAGLPHGNIRVFRVYAASEATVTESTKQLECGPMPNLMVALPNTIGAVCSTPQSLADAHY